MHSTEFHHEYLWVYIFAKKDLIVKTIPEMYRKKTLGLSFWSWSVLWDISQDLRETFFSDTLYILRPADSDDIIVMPGLLMLDMCSISQI